MATINEIMKSNPSGVKIRYRGWDAHRWFSVYFYEAKSDNWYGFKYKKVGEAIEVPE